MMIKVYKIHHSPNVWEDPKAYKPERFPMDEGLPTKE